MGEEVGGGRGEENDIGWKELVEAEENEQTAVNRQETKRRDSKPGLTKLHLKKYGNRTISQSPKKPNIDDDDDDGEVIVDETAKAYSIGDRSHETDEEGCDCSQSWIF